MTRTKAVLAAMALMAVVASGANGALVNDPNQLFWGGGITVMDVVNYENLVKGVNPDTGEANTLAAIQPGDSLEGVFIINFSYLEGAIGNKRFPDGFELTGHFRGLVQGVSPLNATDALFEIVPDPVFEAVYGTGALLAAFVDNSLNFKSAGTAMTPLTMAQSIASATDGSLFVVMGADPTQDWGDISADGVGYYWAANGSLLPSVSSFAASLDMIVNNTSISDTLFLGVTQDPPSSGTGSFTNEPVLSTINNEFALQGNVAPNNENYSPWALKSQDPLRCDAVPEGSSFLTFGMLMAIGGLFGFRRRNG